MSQNEQKAVGSIDPYAHTTSNQINTSSAPVRDNPDNLQGSTHHAASPSVEGGVYQQNQGPPDPFLTSKITTTPPTTTTATPVTTTSATASDRKPSLTDTLIAGAATAATTATIAATNAVAAARRLVGNDGSSEIDLDNETPDTVQIEETSSPKGGILNFIKSSSTNNGLEFSQRKLSVNKNKRHSSHHPISSTTAAAASVPTVTPTTVHNDDTEHPMQNAVPNNTATQTTNNTTQRLMQTSMQHSMHNSTQDSMEQQHPVQQQQQHPIQQHQQHSIQQQRPIQQAVPANAQTAAPAPTNITFSENPPVTKNNNNGTNTTTATVAGAPTNSLLHRRNSIAGQTAVLTEPHHTLYVTRQGGARSHALGVDQPSVSSTSKTIKTQTQSGLGVDKPVYVGVHEDPKTQARRRGSLHVDKTPVFSQNALNDPNDKDQNSYTGNLVESNSVAGNEKPASLKDSLSRRRRSSSSGLNVDPPTVATSNIAGSGSTDHTNNNRPKGTYNSGINVDRAGHHDRKISGFGVDKPAIVTHQMAAATKTKNLSPIVPGLNTKTTTTNNRSHSPTPSNHQNPQNSTIQPYSTTTTTSETVINPAEMGPTITYQNPPSFSSSAPVDPVVVPADYDGPIPQVNPGEQVIWVKKTVVQTEYYDGAPDNTGTPMPPAPTQDSGTQNRRGSAGSLLDRIRGRRTSAVSTDKGKQRT
ncbi:hypothetical protein BG015_011608 [Linnemannia schmuckeri]|uniref:Uncharacterized protein n=1 Tax=Linnemannia schmuckeri TaxID=64567 RepID=A0A9P5S4U0_9FUNG|nr:hypothetical protein BG015_011608 [Linnemannia schmuckeri]